MDNLRILSKIYIEIMKNFHAQKQPLTVDSLREALSARQELTSILREHDLNKSAGGNALLTQSSNLSNHSSNDDRSEKCYIHTTQTGGRILEILNICSILLGDNDTQRFSEIEKKVTESQSLDALLFHGSDIVGFIQAVINNAVSKSDFTNDFLNELGKDLVQIERQLVSFHSYNKEMHSANNEFSDGLRGHTKEMSQILRADKGLEEVRRFILSKLSIIMESIEKKAYEDKIKLEVAEQKMSDLQASLRTYSDEILQVTERASALEKEILLDQLMGISNRRAYDLQIRESLRRYQRNQESFSLILIDVDNFKAVNDTYGHQAGDRCLKEIAKCIKFCLRKSDFLARYGGEEIIAILPGAAASDAKKVAEKIRECIEKTVFWHNGVHFSVTVSAGLTAVTATDKEPDTIFSRVDSAMYEAKKCGRNRIRVL